MSSMKLGWMGLHLLKVVRACIQLNGKEFLLIVILQYKPSYLLFWKMYKSPQRCHRHRNTSLWTDCCSLRTTVSPVLTGTTHRHPLFPVSWGVRQTWRSTDETFMPVFYAVCRWSGKNICLRVESALSSLHVADRKLNRGKKFPLYLSKVASYLGHCRVLKHGPVNANENYLSPRFEIQNPKGNKYDLISCVKFVGAGFEKSWEAELQFVPFHFANLQM